MEDASCNEPQSADFIEPGIDCAHLCYDCEKSAYCWDSDLLEKQ